MTKVKGAIAGVALITSLGILILAAVAVAGDPSASHPTGSKPELATMAWDDSNIEYLRSMKDPTVEGDSEVVKFVCYEDTITDVRRWYGETCGMSDFDWVDLAGNRQYSLVIVSYRSTDPHNWLRIYDRDSSGKIGKQQFDGYHLRLAGIAKGKGGPFRIYTPLHDLNGDGKIELVILDALDTPDPTGRFHALALWPKVYSLKNGKYVESSREFANFYDTQVLPRLNLTAKDPEQLAAVEMARDKILRVLGRDPAAGERQARQWMTSPDLYLRHDAVVVFRDMGDHEADLAEAERKEKELRATLPGSQ
jgi:hypothetical protein